MTPLEPLGDGPSPSEWDDAAPWEPEALETLFDEVDELVRRYVAFPSEHARHAVVLWAFHAHALDAFESTPRLALISPEKGSGKTRCLELLELLVPTARHAVNMSAAALFRQVAANRPSLLMDEADTYFGPRSGKDHEELRGLINAGHRRGAVAYRVVGEGGNMQVKEFPAFCAVALAGIGDLPDTVLDRSVLVAMKRRSPGEHLDSFRHRKVAPVASRLRERMAQWAEANVEALTMAEPPMPAGLVDRAADVWEPLVALGDAAGGPWPARARTAAVVLNAARTEADPSLGVRLLSDTRAVFTEAAVDRFSTEQLVERLVELDESPWGDIRGKPLDARGLARRLRKYEVRPSSIRLAGRDTSCKGYLSEWFHDAWHRYLPQESGTAGTTEQPRSAAASEPPPATLFRSAPEQGSQPDQDLGALSRSVTPVPAVPLSQGRDTLERPPPPPFPGDDRPRGWCVVCDFATLNQLADGTFRCTSVGSPRERPHRLGLRPRQGRGCCRCWRAMSQVVPPLVLLEFDAEAERQLVALLDALPRLARANGVVPSPALLRLAAALSDRTRAQETAGRDDGAVALQGVGVRLLHPYDEVAQLLGGVSRDTVERLVRSGMLPAVRVGRRCLVRHDDVVAYVASLPTSVAS